MAGCLDKRETRADAMRRIEQNIAKSGQHVYLAAQGADIPDGEMRGVPLSTLLGADDSLLPVLDLEIGEGLEFGADDV